MTGLDGLGVGLLLDGLALGLVLTVGLVVGELWLAVGCGVGVEDRIFVLVGLAVGLGDELLVGVAEADADADADADPEDEDLPVGVALADPEDEALPVGVAPPEALGEPVRLSVESSRTAAFGRLEQAPFTMGGPPRRRATEAPNTSELDARSMKPVSAPSATGLTRRALIGTPSSWPPSPECSCPTWSSQYACPD